MARDTGFLTESQREYLTGEKDLDDHSNPWQFKSRIRKRVNGSFEDLALLRESPYWSDEDHEKIARDPLQPNTGVLASMDTDTKERHIDGVRSQAKIYGDSVQGFVEAIENMDEIDGSWQDSDDMERELKNVFARQVVHVVDDVLNLVGVSDRDTKMEIFEDAWPDREQVVKVANEELQ